MPIQRGLGGYATSHPFFADGSAVLLPQCGKGGVGVGGQRPHAPEKVKGQRRDSKTTGRVRPIGGNQSSLEKTQGSVCQVRSFSQKVPNLTREALKQGGNI